jgi:hypothetical protein
VEKDLYVAEEFPSLGENGWNDDDELQGLAKCIGLVDRKVWILCRTWARRNADHPQSA